MSIWSCSGLSDLPIPAADLVVLVPTAVRLVAALDPVAVLDSGRLAARAGEPAANTDRYFDG